jgi:hypothetical protein
MEQEPVRLGRLSKALEKALGVDFGEDVFVYVSEEELRCLAKRWAESYLLKLEEAAKIIRCPLYAAYDGKNQRLYLLKEYVTSEGFKKAALEIVREGQWHLKRIFGLTPEKEKELALGLTIIPIIK